VRWSVPDLLLCPCRSLSISAASRLDDNSGSCTPHTTYAQTHSVHRHQGTSAPSDTERCSTERGAPASCPLIRPPPPPLALPCDVSPSSLVYGLCPSLHVLVPHRLVVDVQ
jgi:hypothetical protein